MGLNQFAVLGGDLRFTLLSDALKQDRKQVFSLFQAGSGAISLPALADVDCIILPLPISKDGIHLNAPFHNAQPPRLEHIFTQLNSKQMILGGIVDEKTRTLADLHGLSLFDYYTEESFILTGALATAEGAISLAIAEHQSILQGQKALIFGFGRIAKILAQKLSALGVCVCICARKQIDLDWANTLGYRYLPFSKLDDVIHEFALLFNTVPHPILDFQKLVFLQEQALYIELASKPYGIDFHTAENLGIHCILAESIPGKVAPFSMAHALKDSIYSILQDNKQKE